MPAPDRLVLVRQRVRGRRTWGTVSVEMAIVAPILVVMLFGIIEMGAMFRDALTLNSACREGARSAALGATTTLITGRLQAAAPGLTSTSLTTTMQYRTYINGTWGSWTTLANSADGTANSAPNGAQLKIRVTYPHPLITGPLFASLLTGVTNNRVSLSATMVMTRE